MTSVLRSGPKNARIDPDSGLRYYSWQGREVPSVTSARSMAGLPFNLARWQVSRVCYRATEQANILAEMLHRPRRPREHNKTLDENRRKEARAWLRAAHEEERDYKALRGTAVHEAADRKMQPADVTDFLKIKLRVPLLGEDGKQLVTEAKGTPRVHTIEREGFDPLAVDIDGELVSKIVVPADEIISRLRQYLAWLEASGAEILVSEGQVWNMTLGYAGSFDILCRFPNGEIWIVDLKTGDDSYSDYVLQQCGYLMAEFVGADDIVDEAATELLHRVNGVAILHLHEDSWEFLRLKIDDQTWAAFRGLLKFATWTSAHATEETFVVARKKGSADGQALCINGFTGKMDNWIVCAHRKDDHLTVNGPGPCGNCPCEEFQPTSRAPHVEHVHEYRTPQAGMEDGDYTRYCAGCGVREEAA